MPEVGINDSHLIYRVNAISLSATGSEPLQQQNPYASAAPLLHLCTTHHVTDSRLVEAKKNMACECTLKHGSAGVVLVIVDGLSDVSLPVLSQYTPLQASCLPALDDLTKHGQCGLMDPVCPGLACGSDTAHLAIFGYEPRDCYRGRGAFEAIGDGIDISPGDVAFKCNFATVEEKSSTVLQRRVDRNFGKEAFILCKMLDNVKLPSFPDVHVTVKHAMKHRCGIRIRGSGLCDLVSDTDPLVDKQQLKTCVALDPKDYRSVRTAAVVRELSKEMMRILNTSEINSTRISEGRPPANVVLLRGASEGINVESTFYELHGLNAFLIAPTKIIAGIGRTVGIPIVDVEGATGDYNTSFRNKADACVSRMLEKANTQNSCKSSWLYDVGIVHVKAVDDAGHDGDLERKIKHMEDVDRMVERIVTGLVDGGRPYAGIMVIGDHTTPVSYTDHTCEPVPCIIATACTSKRGGGGQGLTADSATVFDEIDIGTHGALGRFPGQAVMFIVKSYLEFMRSFEDASGHEMKSR